MYSRGFSCILEGDMQKIIANFEQQIGLSANLKDFCQLAGTSDVSTFYLGVATSTACTPSQIHSNQRVLITIVL